MQWATQGGMEGWAGVDGVMGGFGASRVGRAHLLANRRGNRIVLNPPRPIHHFGTPLTPFHLNSAASGRLWWSRPWSIGRNNPAGTLRGRTNRLSPPRNTQDTRETILHNPMRPISPQFPVRAPQAPNRAPLSGAEPTQALQRRTQHGMHGQRAT